MSATEELTSGSGLQQFVLLAKAAKGKACAAVIQQALGAPNVFVFGELLEMPNVQQLAETEDKNALELLKIFAYGTYADYKAGQFPTLTPAQTKKLRQLTIVSLSAQSKVIPYHVLQKQLEISELRELEDLIIDAIYQGVIQGQLDQRRSQLEVELTMGRDLKPEAMDAMLSVLTNWAGQADSLLSTIKEKINYANFVNENEKKHKEDFDKRVEVVKSNLKATLEADLLQAADFSDPMDFLDERNRKGRKMKGRDFHHSGRDHRRGMN